MNVTAKQRKRILNFFIENKGHKHRCKKCDRDAWVMCVIDYVDSHDYVFFKCPNCRRGWMIRLIKDEIEGLLVAKN